MCKPAQSLHDPNPQSSESFPVLLMDYGEGRESVKRRSFGRLHWHADLQFVLVSMGSLELDCSGAHAALADGQGAFLNAGAPHRIAPGVGRAYTSLLFPAKMLGFFPGSEMSSRCVEPYVGTVGEPCRILDGSESWHQEALRELWKATSLLRGGDGPLQRYRACAAIAAAWGTYVASIDLPLRNPALALAEERMRAFAGFIDEHYAEHVSLADIAAAAGVSKAECGRVFRRVLQTTPYAYLTEVRISHATELLREGQLSVADVASETGFGSASHFSNAFRKATGMSPRAYVKQFASPLLGTPLTSSLPPDQLDTH